MDRQQPKKKVEIIMDILYVAADIAKLSFTTACWKGKKSEYWQSHKNTPEGYVTFAAEAYKAQIENGAKQIHLIIEPTGGYELGLALFAYELGWLVTKPNPKHTRDWANGMGYRAKTDKIDAKMLAEYGGRNEPAPQEVVPEEVRELDYYLRRLEDIKKDIQAERNRLKNLRQKPDVPQALIEQVERSLVWLYEQIDAIDELIKDLLKRTPELYQRRCELLTIPGVGLKNSLPILVLCYRFHALTSGTGTKKQIAAFLGLDSQTSTSGTSVRGTSAISKQGPTSGRAFLYMGALGGIRGKNVLRVYYKQMLERGKAKKVALVACSRKILTWAWAVFSTGTSFDATKFPHLNEALG